MFRYRPERSVPLPPALRRLAVPAALAAAVACLWACAVAIERPARGSSGAEAPPPVAAPAAGAPRDTTSFDEAARLEEIRAELRSLFLVQGVLDWYTRTQGEESILAETYRGHERLFSAETVRFVGEAARRAAARGAPEEERRALDFLHTSLALSAVGLQTAVFDDEQANAETAAKVTLPWMEEPVGYRDLDGLLSAEPDPERRAVIQQKVAEVYRDLLNPILERKEARARQVVRDLGFDSYIALSERFRLVDIRDLATRAGRFFRSSDALYMRLLEQEARDALGMPAESVRRSDIARLARAPHLEKFFPGPLMLPAFEEFLSGIGLDLTTAAGTRIRIDDAAHPGKEPRAACYPLRVPRDIRVTVKPAGGMDDFHTFFHEGGHALHFAWTTTDRWEFQQLGNSMTTEGWAEFFSHAWDDPAWLLRYRRFVRRWNEAHPAAAVPVMTDEDIRLTVRHRAFWNLYFLRRYGRAKLVYETALHGGDISFYDLPEGASASDLQDLYRRLFGEAYGFALSPTDALRFRTDVDDFFYAADYARAYNFADMVHEAMRSRFGEDWYGRPEVGALLKETCWKDGTRLQGDEALALLGHPGGQDLEVSRRRTERLLAWQGIGEAGPRE